MRFRRRGPVAALLLACLACGLARGAAEAAPTQPYRLLYDLALLRSASDSNISAVTGEMSYDLRDLCDAWASDFRIAIELRYRDGRTILGATSLSNWEAKDGLSYRFFVKRRWSTGDEQQITGKAMLDGPGQGGSADWTTPEPHHLDLPPGTLFPMQLVAATLAAAEAGETQLYRTTFQGGEDKELYDASLTLQPLAADQREPAMEVLARDQPGWILTAASFAQGSPGGAPEQEMQMQFFANGVSVYRVLDFGAFTLGATLTGFGAGDGDGC